MWLRVGRSDTNGTVGSDRTEMALSLFWLALLIPCLAVAPPTCETMTSFSFPPNDTYLDNSLLTIPPFSHQ